MDIPSHVRKKFYAKVNVETYIIKNQLYGNLERYKPYMRYDTDGLNQYQNFLYNRAINGLAAYDQNQIKRMKPATVKEIQKIHNKTQYCLNIWKQQITNELSTKILDKIWPCSKEDEGKYSRKLKKELIDSTRNFVDPKKKNKLSFRDLGIKKTDIVKKLIAEKILPSNFYELKPKT